MRKAHRWYAKKTILKNYNYYWYTFYTVIKFLIRNLNWFNLDTYKAITMLQNDFLSGIIPIKIFFKT